MSNYTQVIPAEKSLADLQAEAANEASIRAAYLKKVRDEVVADIGALIVAFPEIQTLSVRGYTPGFNDGDPCYHHQLDPMLNGVDRYGEDEEEDRSTFPEVSPETHQAVAKLIGSMWKRLEDAFGTDWKLTFTRTPSGITLRQEEYDCGH